MDKLRAHQLELLELLKQFDAICTRLGICYWLDSGTLLGAVRHGGFIPWDDDLDVCVLESDFARIKRLLSDNKQQLYLDCSRKGQTRLSPRFVDKSKILLRTKDGKEVNEPLWIDVLVLREGSIKLKKLVDSIYGRCVRRIYKGINDGWVKRLLAYILMPLALILKAFASVYGKIWYKDTLLHDFGVPFCSIRKKSDIFPLSKIEFEGICFPAPNNPEKYLERIYGDFRKIPEEKKDHDIKL